jgi:hypothetical protein
VLHGSSLAAALIDRLMHHGESFYLNGDSYRLLSPSGGKPNSAYGLVINLRLGKGHERSGRGVLDIQRWLKDFCYKNPTRFLLRCVNPIRKRMSMKSAFVMN